MPAATAGDDLRRTAQVHPWSYPRPSTLPPRDWVAYAACAGSDVSLFFAEAGDTYSAKAVALCGGCPVRNCCLEWALAAHEPVGMWGGLSARARRQVTTPGRLAAIRRAAGVEREAIRRRSKPAEAAAR